MNIVEVEVSNFRLLRDFRLDLSKHKNNLIFVNGSNGRGKTTLLTALRWCFFGDALNPKDFSNSALEKLTHEGQGAIEVTVKFALDQAGNQAIVKRSQSVVIGKSGLPELNGLSALTITELYQDSSRPTQVIPRPENWLDFHLPKRFEKFILFDGELMYKFFDVSVKGAIENAVREIANVDLLDSVVENLKGQLGRLNSSIAKLSGTNAEKLQLALEEAERVRDSLVANLKKANENFDQLNANRQTYASELKGYEQASQFLDENLRLRNRHDEILSRLKQLDIRRTQGVFEVGVTSLILSRVRYPLNKHIKEAEEAGRYPADFQPKALQVLLDEGECICSRPLEAGSESAKAVLGVIQTSVNAGELGAQLQIMDKGVASSEAFLAGAKKGLELAQKDYVAERAELDKVRESLKQLAPKLEGVSGNESHIREVAALLQKTESDISKLKFERSLLVEQVELAKSDVTSAKRKFEKATESTASAHGLRVKAQFLGKAIAQADSFNQTIIENVRERLEKYVSDQYQKVKRGDFVTRITDDFEVQTFDKSGMPARLSEGEKMLKAYIFSIALREVVGLRFPLIVDTPFGRLGEENRKLITETLTDLLTNGKDHQVMFMMHDGEYTPYTRDDFAAIQPFEGYLNWDDKAGETTLGLGVDPTWMKFSAWQDWQSRKAGI